MKQSLYRLVVLAGIGVLAASGSWAQTSGEASSVFITHYPPTAAFSGQAIPIYAEAVPETGFLEKVYLLYSLSIDARPARIQMERIRDNTYSCTIPAKFFAGANEVNYQIRAVTSAGGTAETEQFALSVRDPAKEPIEEDTVDGSPGLALTEAGEVPAASKETIFTKRNLVIGGITLAAVGVGVALSDSGGGGSSSSGVAPNGTNGTETVVTVNQGYNASGGLSQVIDGTANVGAGTVTRVEVSVAYLWDPGPGDMSPPTPSIKAIYNGGSIAERSGPSDGESGTIKGSAFGSSPMVTIEISDTAWTWNATVDFTVEQ